MHLSLLTVIAALAVSMSVVAAPAVPAVFKRKTCLADGKACDLDIYDPDNPCCGYCIGVPVSIESGLLCIQDSTP